MKYTEKEYVNLHCLFERALESEATPEEMTELQQMLSQDSELLQYYFSFVELQSGLHQLKHFEYDLDLTEMATSGSKVGADSNVSLRGVDVQDVLTTEADDFDLSDNSEMKLAILEILEMEKTAPAVDIPKQEPERELIQKVIYQPREKYKFSKFQKFYFAATAAIVLVFAMLVFFSPDYIELPVVAELVDSISADWDGEMKPDEYGEMVQSRYRLKKGHASILFNSGAKITVEAPAEFSLLSGGNMELFSGRIYALVPEMAHGFTVTAGDSKIVDLGTEFGVEVDNGTNTQLHVIRGKTILFAGSSDVNKLQIDVNAGSAKKVYSDGFVKEISVVDDKFVRHIDSNTGVVWNGRSNIGPTGDGLIFSESFESPVVEGYLADSVPATNWVGSDVGHFANHRGLFNQGNADTFSTPYGEQAYLLDYTNSGLTTSETAIKEVLTAGATYTLTFNMAYTPQAVIVDDPKSEQVRQVVLEGMPASKYRVELVAFGPADNRTDLRNQIRYYPGTILAFATGTVTSSDMTADDSIVFTAKTDDPNLGKMIAVRLVKSNGSVLYDNIKLRVWKSKIKNLSNRNK